MSKLQRRDASLTGRQAVPACFPGVKTPYLCSIVSQSSSFARPETTQIPYGVTAAAKSPTSKLEHQRSTLAARSGGAVGQVLMLQPSIGTQATLRLLSQRPWGPADNQFGNTPAQETERMHLFRPSDSARAVMGPRLRKGPRLYILHLTDRRQGKDVWLIERDFCEATPTTQKFVSPKLAVSGLDITFCVLYGRDPFPPALHLTFCVLYRRDPFPLRKFLDKCRFSRRSLG
jgi:hypothetical protein